MIVLNIGKAAKIKKEQDETFAKDIEDIENAIEKCKKFGRIEMATDDNDEVPF